MARVNRIKRRVLREAVEENVELLRGPRRAPRSRRLRSLRRTTGALVAFAVLSVTLAAATWVLTVAGAAGEPLTVVTRPAAAPAPPLPAPPAAAEPARQLLAAPEPIAPAVLSLGVRKIVLDPGHGGANVGTVAPGGLEEKVLTLDIARRLRLLLERDSFEVVMTRSGDESVPLEDRARLANEEEADLFVSIHLNWIEQQEVRGVETYFLGPTDDPYLKRLAAAENQGSGYSLADFRRLLEGVYVEVRQDESRRLARAVQHELYRSLRRVNPEIRDRGVKSAPFLVLVSTEMPAILAEVSCLSNEQEALLLTKPHYRQYIAGALSAGVRAYADSLVPGEEEL